MRRTLIPINSTCKKSNLSAFPQRRPLSFLFLILFLVPQFSIFFSEYSWRLLLFPLSLHTQQVAEPRRVNLLDTHGVSLSRPSCRLSLEKSLEQGIHGLEDSPSHTAGRSQAFLAGKDPWSPRPCKAHLHHGFYRSRGQRRAELTTATLLRTHTRTGYMWSALSLTGWEHSGVLQVP